MKMTVLAVLLQQVELLLAAPPASVSGGPVPGEAEACTRPWTGGCSRGLASAARPLLLAACRRLRSEEVACTALSRIKQVVRLSHNFIVHFSPTAGHGAMRRRTRPAWQTLQSGGGGQRRELAEELAEVQPTPARSLRNLEARASWHTRAIKKKGEKKKKNRGRNKPRLLSGVVCGKKNNKLRTSSCVGG